MGMHIDYGGMPSVRLAVRGADTVVVARAAADRRVRLASFLRSPGTTVDCFAPIELDLEDDFAEGSRGRAAGADGLRRSGVPPASRGHG